MSETCETVVIKGLNGPVVINKSDFDPKVHEQHASAAPAPFEAAPFEAAPVEAAPVEAAPVMPAPVEAPAPKAPADMTVKELKAALAEKGVEFPASAKHDDLVKLLDGAQ